jgi:hypothetical protein
MNYPYQVDWKQEMTGKRIASTKRRVTFTFGFANNDAIAAGDTGVACRGEEFTIVLLWSLTSGKRMVQCNGKPVHQSQGKSMETKFEAQWPMKGEHIVKIIAYSMSSLVPTPACRQFDLHIDGMSFFDMDKIYQLGGGSKNHSVDRVVSSSSSYTSQHTLDRRVHGVATANLQGKSSGSIGDHSTSTMNSMSPTIQQDFLDNYPANHNNPCTATIHDAFAPVTPEIPSFQQVSNQAIMNSYNNNSMAPTSNINAVYVCNDVPNMSTSKTSTTLNTNHGMAQFYSSNGINNGGTTPYGGVPVAQHLPARYPCMNRYTPSTAFSQPSDQQTRLSLTQQSTLPHTSIFPTVAQWNGPVTGTTAMQKKSDASRCHPRIDVVSSCESEFIFPV